MTIIVINEVMMDDKTDDAMETYSHRGGEDGDGTKMIMLRNHRCRRLAACVSIARRRAPIVIVRMMPPTEEGQ